MTRSHVAELLPLHLRRMRWTAAASMALTAAAAAAAFRLPRLPAAGLPPLAVSFLALAGSLWIGFSADRHARRLMERIRGAFEDHGDPARLLADHRKVLAAVLLRLQVITLLGLVTAVSGSGPTAALLHFVLALVLTALAWPTEHKTLLLLRRVGVLG